MLPRNFPDSKNRRRIGALKRMEANYKGEKMPDDVQFTYNKTKEKTREPGVLRGKRTKKRRAKEKGK